VTFEPLHYLLNFRVFFTLIQYKVNLIQCVEQNVGGGGVVAFPSDS